MYGIFESDFPLEMSLVDSKTFVVPVKRHVSHVSHFRVLVENTIRMQKKRIK